MTLNILNRILISALSALTVCAAAAVFLPVTAHAQTAISGPEAAEMAVRHLTVVVGLSKIVESPLNISRASVALPDIIEFVAVSPKELLINGKKEGETSLILWQQGGGRVMFDILVAPNPARVDSVRRQLQDELAGQNVDLVFENNTPFLKGTVKDLNSAERAVTIASILGRPVSMLRVSTPPPQTQILLKVRFADIDRSVETEFGVNFFRNGNTVTSAALSTSQFSPSALTTTTSSGGNPNNTSGISISNALNLFLYNKSIDLGALVNFLEAHNALSMLAEPNLLAIDGKPASFLSGGEFPYPTISTAAGGAGQVSIQFRKFGISIDFVPHITSRGTIRLEVTPEVSSLDFANGLVFQGFNIPALDTRRVQTEVELESGQSFAIGGLLNNQVTETLNKIPGLSNIPLLGKLFESRTIQKNKTELLVLVTPEIVRPVPQDQEPPMLNFPKPPFIKDGLKDPPRTPGMDKTGPVPVTPPSSAMPVETLIEEKALEKDKSKANNQGQTGQSNSQETAQPAPSGSTATSPSASPAPPSISATGAK